MMRPGITVVLMCFIAGCFRQREDSSRNQSKILSVDEIKAIAVNEVWKREGWKGEASNTSHKAQGWFVMVWRLPKTFGGHRVLIIGEDGTVHEYRYGKGLGNE